MPTKLSTPELATHLIGMDGWTVREVDGRPRLSRTYPFARFDDAMAFASRVASAAEEEDHHPRLVVRWGKTTVEWWSHDAGGITTADLTMAKKTDALLAEAPDPHDADPLGRLDPPLGRTDAV